MFYPEENLIIAFREDTQAYACCVLASNLLILALALINITSTTQNLSYKMVLFFAAQIFEFQYGQILKINVTDQVNRLLQNSLVA